MSKEFNEAVEAVMDQHSETLERLAESEMLEAEDSYFNKEDFEDDAAKLAERRAEAEHNRVVAEQYRKYVGELKKKLKSHSKNQLVEMIANQAWQFNHLQQMARQVHEKNIELEKAIKPEGESNV